MTPHTILRAAQARTLRRMRRHFSKYLCSVAVYRMAKVRWQLEMRLRAQEARRSADARLKELLSGNN